MTEHVLPLELVVSSLAGLRMRCTATPEQNNGESCLWTWQFIRDAHEANGLMMRTAINHAIDRHMWEWSGHEG